MYLLFMAAFGLLLSPFLTTIKIEAASRQYNPLTFSKEQLAQNIRQLQEEVIEPSYDIGIPDLPSVLQGLPLVKRENVIGFISIEAVDLYLPIFHGVTNTNLLAGAATMQNEQQMGEGNYVLAGHHMQNSSLLFGPLLKVQPGQRVLLSDLENIYTYEVERLEVVHQNQTDILEHSEQAIITLFTCDRSDIYTDYRLVVQGNLIDVSDISENVPSCKTYYNSWENVAARKNFGLALWFISVAGLALLVLTAMNGLFLRIEGKKK